MKTSAPTKHITPIIIAADAYVRYRSIKNNRAAALTARAVITAPTARIMQNISRSSCNEELL
jgi:hypothetical protein